jgi:hypothetical protein
MTGRQPSQQRSASPRARVLGVVAGVTVAVIAVIAVVIGRSGSGWVWVDDGEALATAGDTFGAAIAAGGPGLVAVGHTTTVGARSGVVWTSSDGLAWDRVATPALGRTGEDVSVEDVAATAGGLVIVGSVANIRGGIDHPAVWTSVDGVEWHDAWRGDTAGRMLAVTAFGDGAVAVGTDGVRGAVWLSHDLATWERIDDASFVADQPQHPDGPEPALTLNSVTQGGPGLVAVGESSQFAEVTRNLATADVRAVVFTSEDGQRWTRIPHDEALFGGSERATMKAVIEGGPGLVAIGYSPPRGPLAWTSVDGLTWQRHDRFAGRSSDVRLLDVVATTDPRLGLVAVGQDWGPFTGSPRDRVAVYTSRDGRSWTRSGDRALSLGRPHQALLSGVAVFEHGVVAVGTVVNHSPDGYDATVWFLPESR